MASEGELPLMAATGPLSGAQAHELDADERLAACAKLEVSGSPFAREEALGEEAAAPSDNEEEAARSRQGGDNDDNAEDEDDYAGEEEASVKIEPETGPGAEPDTEDWPTEDLEGAADELRSQDLLNSDCDTHQSASEAANAPNTPPEDTLNDGNRMPLLGIGTWNAQGKELSDAVKVAIKAGYRHIDTAANYKNEHLVGEAIFESIQEGVVRREDLFVTTKLWNNSHGQRSVPKALKKSLAALQLSYVDLYLVHYPIGYKEGDMLSPLDENGQVITSDVDYIETWRGMEDCKLMGLTKSIGVSNFNSEQLARVLSKCSIKPSMNQVECHPYLTQEKLLKFCRSHGIELTAYSPLGSPGRLDPSGKEPHLIEDSTVRRLAKKYNRPAAQILIRYQIQRGIVVIPKAIQAAHIKSNLEAAFFELDLEDMKCLNWLNRNYRFMKFERCLKHKYYPFNVEF